MPPDVFIGTDIVEISRIRDLIKSHPKRFIQRTFSPKEQDYCQSKANISMHFAGRFAAKEAIKKALMTSGFNEPIAWLDMEILASEIGAPVVYLNRSKFQSLECKVSISHTVQTAIAFSILQKK